MSRTLFEYLFDEKEYNQADTDMKMRQYHLKIPITDKMHMNKFLIHKISVLPESVLQSARNYYYFA